jgi:hypothetical protein
MTGILTRCVMGKGRGGRPKKADGEMGTKHIRAMNDVAEMIGWIHRFEGIAVAQIVDPMLRGPVTARYKRYEEQVEAIKLAEAAAQKKGRKATGS